MKETDSREYVFENLDSMERQLGPEHKFISHPDKIRKLVDYIRPESSRYVDSENRFHEIVSPQNEGFKNVQAELEGAQKDIKDSTTRLVTILSIFSGIILSFSGGINLIGNALQSLSDSVHSYKLFMLIFVIGFILYNLIISLMFIVSRFNRKDIGVSCKHGYYCDCCGERNKKGLNSVLCQGINKYPHFVVPNLVFLYCLYALFVLWLFSSRNTDLFMFLQGMAQWIQWVVEIILIVLPIGTAIVYFRKKCKPIEDNDYDNKGGMLTSAASRFLFSPFFFTPNHIQKLTVYL